MWMIAMVLQVMVFGTVALESPLLREDFPALVLINVGNIFLVYTAMAAFRGVRS